MPFETITHTESEMAEFRARQAHKRKAAYERVHSGSGATGRGSVRDHGADPEGEVHKPEQMKVKASTEILMKDIMAKLSGVYPGFRWSIQPSERGQIFNIFCDDFHRAYGYTIRMVDVMHDPRRKEAVRAGGSIMERFGYRHRGPTGGIMYNRGAIMEMPRDQRGQCIPDISDFENRRERSQAEIAKAIAEGRARTTVLENGEQMISFTD